MRRLFVYLLLIVLPLQFTWAAASGYCGHETGISAKHLGHHDHKHAGQTQPMDQSKGAGLTHADCEMCHFGCSMPSVEVLITPTVAPRQDVSADPLQPASHIPALPERPDRLRAA